MAEKRIVHWALDALVDAKNPINAKDHDLGAIIASMERFGFVNPVIVDDTSHTIVAGHGRVDALVAMRDRGYDPPQGICDNSDELLEDADPEDWVVPCIMGTAFPDDDDRDAYTLADNQTTMAGGWDTKMLVENLTRLVETPKGLAGTGFDGDDLDHLRALLEETSAPAPERQRGLDSSYTPTDRRYGVTCNLRSEMEEDEASSLLEAYGFTVKRHSHGEGTERNF